MLRRMKMTPANLKAGGKYIAASVIVEGLLLAPKVNINVGEKEITIGGIIPMLQKEIATVVRDTVNTVVPKAAVSTDRVLRNMDLKDKSIDRILWFVYDYMEKYSLSAVVTTVLEKTRLADASNVTTMLRDNLNSVMENKDDRDKLIKGLTEALMNALGVIAEGTVLSAFFSERVVESTTELMTAVIDKAMQTEYGANVVERLLDAVDHFETMTLASFLQDHLGYDRYGFEQALSDFYERNVGSEMVAKYLNLGLGDELYAKIAGMNYDAVFQDITENHWKDLVRVTLSAASAGLYMMNLSKKMDDRSEKRQNRKTKKQAKKSAKEAAQKALEAERKAAKAEKKSSRKQKKTAKAEAKVAKAQAKAEKKVAKARKKAGLPLEGSTETK